MNSTNPSCPLCTARALTCDGDCLATLHKSGSKDGENCQNEPAFPTNSKGGPRTAQGKAVSARSALADPEGATTHSLFARDVVLPSLGEDPEGYRQLEAEWTAQLQPRNLLERHYVEKIAAASWRLRRLHRWQAQLFEAELTEDERLNKLDKVMRHETNLHRQIDTSVKMLNKDVPQLYKGRARDRALVDTMQTELDCRENRENELEVEFEAREHLKAMEAAASAPFLDYARLDAQNGQNEPTPRAAAAPPGGRSFSERDSSPRPDAEPNTTDCQNEPTTAGSLALSENPSLTGRGGEPQASRGGSDLGVLVMTRSGRILSSAAHPHGWPQPRWADPEGE